MYFILICHILLLIIYWCWLFSCENVLIILDWCLCDFLLLKHIDEVDGLHPHLSLTYFFVCKIFHNFNIVFDYLLMLTIFHVENVLIILNWCLCDFLVLKHIDEVDVLHPHLSYTAFDYLLMLTFFMWKCSYHSRLMFMWFSVTETYRWSGWTSSSFVIDIFFCV